MIDPPPEQVTWYYGQWQSAYEDLDIPKLRLEEGLPKSFDTGKRNVVVIDDLMAETDGRVTGLPFLPRDSQGRLPVAWVKYDIQTSWAGGFVKEGSKRTRR